MPAPHDSVATTCTQICDFMNRTWQRLPISLRIHEPLPLAVTVSVFHGSDQLELFRLSSVMDAVALALRHATTPIWMTARPGGGKTTALRWVAHQLAVQPLSDEARLPLYIDLGQLGHELPMGPLSEVIAAQLKKRRPIDYRPFQGQRHRLLVLLDGLDLLGGKLSPRALLDDALNQDEFLLLVAGRHDANVELALNDWPASVRIQLGALAHDERENWLQAHATLGLRDRYHAIVAANPLLDSLLDTPLLFAMTAATCLDSPDFSEFRTDQFPGRTGILAGFVEYSLRRAQREGRVTADMIQRLPQALPALEYVSCEAARVGFRDRLPKTYVQDLFGGLTRADEASGRVRHALAWEHILSISLAAGWLEEHASHFTFLHQQFAEYFAGRELARRWAANLEKSNFNSYAARSLRLRDLDALTAHALSILSNQPDGGQAIEQVFRVVAETDLYDACELLSSTGAPQVADLLTAIAFHNLDDEGTWQCALRGLSTLPHSKSVSALLQLLGTSLPSRTRLAQRTIYALGRLTLPESQAALDEVAANRANLTWIRTTAVRVGGTLGAESTLSCAEAAAIDDSLDEEIRADAVEVISSLRKEKATTALMRLLARVDLSVNLRSIAAIAIRRLQTASPSSRSADLSESPVIRQLHEFLQHLKVEPRLRSRLSATLSDASDFNPSEALLVVGAEVPTLLRLIECAHACSRVVYSRLLDLCARSPLNWELIECSPDSKWLTRDVLRDLAKQAGRRYLQLPSDRTGEDGNRSGHRCSEPADDVVRPKTKRLSCEAILASYLAHCRDSGAEATVRDAEDYSEEIGHKWGKSTFQRQPLWELYQQEIAARAQGRRRRVRKRRK